MTDWRDEVKQDYEDLKRQFRNTNVEDFKSGDWFASMVQWMLENYAKEVDGAYIRRKYPGTHPANQANKAIALAAKYNGAAGGVAAAAITALELSSIGPQVAITVPTIGAAIMADVAFSTRTQLRTTYDLAMIHGAPLAVDDVEDCYLVFLTAMGVKVTELMGGVGKAVGPQIVSYNVRKMLRAGLRRALQEALKKIGGTRLARMLTERAMMRLLVPGVSIPIAVGFNHYFTKQILSVANIQMLRRGAVVQPVLRLYKRVPSLDKTAVIKVFISVADTGDAEGWGGAQMDGLRHCQSVMGLSDAELSSLDIYFERTIDQVLTELPAMPKEAFDDLVQLAIAGGAMYPDNRHDAAFGDSVAKISEKGATQLDAREAAAMIAKSRKKLL